MAQDLSNTAQAALGALAEALLGKDLNRIVRRAVDVFGKMALDQQDAVVEAASSDRWVRVKEMTKSGAI